MVSVVCYGHLLGARALGYISEEVGEDSQRDQGLWNLSDRPGFRDFLFSTSTCMLDAIDVSHISWAYPHGMFVVKQDIKIPCNCHTTISNTSAQVSHHRSWSV